MECASAEEIAASIANREQRRMRNEMKATDRRERTTSSESAARKKWLQSPEWNRSRTPFYRVKIQRIDDRENRKSLQNNFVMASYLSVICRCFLRIYIATGLSH
jgi:hypothetical protein